jgi:hypothetical protein
LACFWGLAGAWVWMHFLRMEMGRRGVRWMGGKVRGRRRRRRRRRRGVGGRRGGKRERVEVEQRARVLLQGVVTSKSSVPLLHAYILLHPPPIPPLLPPTAAHTTSLLSA